MTAVSTELLKISSTLPETTNATPEGVAPDGFQCPGFSGASRTDCRRHHTAHKVPVADRTLAPALSQHRRWHRQPLPRHHQQQHHQHGLLRDRQWQHPRHHRSAHHRQRAHPACCRLPVHQRSAQLLPSQKTSSWNISLEYQAPSKNISAAEQNVKRPMSQFFLQENASSHCRWRCVTSQIAIGLASRHVFKADLNHGYPCRAKRLACFLASSELSFLAQRFLRRGRLLPISHPGS
jgi:hypothetical protein